MNIFQAFLRFKDIHAKIIKNDQIFAEVLRLLMFVLEPSNNNKNETET